MKKYGITVGDLKEVLKKYDDELEIFIRNSVNPCGNIAAMCEIKDDTYGFFGESIPCLIIGSESNTEFEE